MGKTMTDRSNRRFNLIVFIAAILWGLLINEANLAHIKQINPQNIRSNTKSTVYGYTIWSIDNAFYTTQIKNIINGHGYTLNPHNPEMKVRRTPVYPLFYGIHYILFGEKYSFFIIRYVQLILLVLSCILLGEGVFNLTRNRLWSRITTVLVAFSPFLSIYAYHTITESITPTLVMISFYTLSSCYVNPKLSRFIIAGIVLGLTILTRPLTGLLLPGLLPIFYALNKIDILKLKFNNSIKHISFYLIGIVLVISPWTIRNYFVTGGELIPLEKYYYNDPMADAQLPLGSSHLAFRNWISGWANPANVSAENFSLGVIAEISNGNYENEKVISDFMKKVPADAYKGYSKTELYDALKSLNDCYVEKQKLKLNNPQAIMNDFASLNCEKEAEGRFLLIKKKFIDEAPLTYYLYTPLLIIKEGIFHSFSNGFASLNPNDRKFNLYQIIIKTCMYILNVSLFISTIVILFLKIPSLVKWICILFPFSLISILAFGLFRYIHAGYLIPIYPFLYISLAGIISIFFKSPAQNPEK